MSYLPMGFPLFQSFESPWRGAPGPLPPPPRGTVAGPSMPAQLFPTSNLHWGDVVNVTGPFQGLHQGQIRVKFTGASWQAPVMQGPFSASVRVPDGAETGECLIEINGRRAFGTQCSITPRTGSYGQRVEPTKGPYGEAWKDFGEKSRMSLSNYGEQMSYRRTRYGERGISMGTYTGLGESDELKRLRAHCKAGKDCLPMLKLICTEEKNFSQAFCNTLTAEDTYMSMLKKHKTWKAPRAPAPVVAPPPRRAKIWDPVSKKWIRKKRTTVAASRVRGARRDAFTVGQTGILVVDPGKVVITTPTEPARTHPPGASPVTSPGAPDPAPEEVVVIERPGTDSPPAGVMPGEPPAGATPVPVTPVPHYGTHTPAGPTLWDAASSRNRALDRVAEMERQAAELVVPSITPEVSKNNKLLIYGAIGIGALAFVYMLTRKR